MANREADAMHDAHIGDVMYNGRMISASVLKQVGMASAKRLNDREKKWIMSASLIAGDTGLEKETCRKCLRVFVLTGLYRRLERFHSTIKNLQLPNEYSLAAEVEEYVDSWGSNKKRFKGWDPWQGGSIAVLRLGGAGRGWVPPLATP